MKKSVHVRLAASAISMAIFATCISPSALAQDPDPLSRNDAIYNSLPTEVKEAGVINAATEPSYPPFEFRDENNQLVGADLDISAALGEIMGVPIKNHQTEFASIIPGLEAGRFDVGISSMGDYVSRQEKVDFVDYYRGGTSFLVREGSPEPKEISDLCGTTIGVQKGTASETMAHESSEKCANMGKEPIEVRAFPSQTAAVLALTSGRIDSVSGDIATNGFSAKQTGPSLKNVGQTVYEDRPYYGIAIPKNSPLYQPFFDAMAILMGSGKYTEILEKWGLEGGAIEKPLKNQGSEG